MDVQGLDLALFRVAGLCLLVLVEGKLDKLVKQLLNVQEHAPRVDEPEELLFLRRVREYVVKDLRVRGVMARNHEAERGHLGPDLVYRNSHRRPDLVVGLLFCVLVVLAEHDIVVVLSSLLGVFVVVVVVQGDDLERLFRKSRAIGVIQERLDTLVVFQTVQVQKVQLLGKLTHREVGQPFYQHF